LLAFFGIYQSIKLMKKMKNKKEFKSMNEFDEYFFPSELKKKKMSNKLDLSLEIPKGLLDKIRKDVSKLSF